MGKKSLEPITESMYYVLLCLHNRNMYGTEIAELIHFQQGSGFCLNFLNLCHRFFKGIRTGGRRFYNTVNF